MMDRKWGQCLVQLWWLATSYHVCKHSLINVELMRAYECDHMRDAHEVALKMYERCLHSTGSTRHAPVMIAR